MLLIKFPSYEQLMHLTVEALKKLGGTGTNGEILDNVIEVGELSNEVVELMHNNTSLSELESRLSWARSVLKRYDAVNNSSRGVWKLTEKGYEITENQYIEIFQKHGKFVQKQLVGNLAKKDKNTIEKKTDDDQTTEEFQVSDQEEGWREQVLNILIHQVTAYEFEKLCQELLRESGFSKVEVTRNGGDEGIDGIGILHVNLITFKVLFQCKRWKSKVPPSTVRDFRGAMQGRCDKGLIITTGFFTKDAKKEAIRDGAPTIDLIDGYALCDLLKNTGLGIKTEMKEVITVDEEWFKKYH